VTLFGYTLLDPWFLLAIPLVLAAVWCRLSVRRAALPTAAAHLFEGLPRTLRQRLAWLPLALLALSGLALSLALATMSRSTKEGQYYLMPLVLVTMPLAMISIMPSTEISLGNALIPITGVMLLLRALIEGEYLVALKFLIPVTLVTGACCLMAIRWAIHQFNDESVLFRESERFSVGLWLRHLVRDRGVTPSLAEGVMCGMLLLLFQFFVRLAAPAPEGWSDFLVSTLAVQIGLILAPVLLMTFMLTSSARRTLLLVGAPISAIAAAVLLTFFLIPIETAFRAFVMELYPVSPATMELLKGVASLIEGVPTWQLILLMALTPAICEELAFRGFIMSGLRHIGSRTLAIFISSLFFGIVHGVLQQSINAFMLGIVLGYIAVQTGSILPCMVFHFVHNAAQVLLTPYLTVEFINENPRMSTFFIESEVMGGTLLFRTPFVVASILATGLLLRWFRSLPGTPSPEERLHQALDESAATAS